MNDITLIQALSTNQKKDNREVIIDHLVSEPGVVVLNETQQRLLERWNFADDLIRSGRFKAGEIVKILQKKFEISSPATAWKTLNDAKYVFGATFQSNKRYLLAVHADRIEFAMQECLKTGDFRAYAALSSEYTRAVKEMPDDSRVRTEAPRPIFILQQNQFNVLNDQPADMHEIRETTKQFLNGEIELDGDE